MSFQGFSWKHYLANRMKDKGQVMLPAWVCTKLFHIKLALVLLSDAQIYS